MSRANLFRFLGRRSRILLVALCLRAMTTSCTLPGAQAQTAGPPPIRVESNDVLVPVLVLDKKRLDRIHRMDLSSFIREANAPGSHLFQDLAVLGLPASDFHVFEDGREQKILRVTSNLESGLGGPGQQEWVTNLPFGAGPDVIIHLPDWPVYLVAYQPPPSPVGSCHQVTVKVHRSRLLLYARPEYCNTPHAANDPLKGTHLGNQMEADIGSASAGEIRLSVMAFHFSHGTAAADTDVVLEFPASRGKLDCTNLPEIGFLGMVYTSNGDLADRFSGLLFGDFSLGGESVPLIAPSSTQGQFPPCQLIGPNRFQTRLDLAPGEYVLKAVMRDGNKFGRTETAINVENYDGKQLAISGIALAREYPRSNTQLQKNASALANYFAAPTGSAFEALTADTRFTEGEPLGFYFEVYSPQQTAPAATTVMARLRILDRNTGRVVKDLQPMNTDFYRKPGDPVMPIGGEIDITDLPSGSYELQARATDSSGQSTVWRSVAFRIE